MWVPDLFLRQDFLKSLQRNRRGNKQIFSDTRYFKVFPDGVRKTAQGTDQQIISEDV